MDEHGRGKVSLCKQLCNVTEVGTNLVSTGCVLRIDSFRLDGAAIRIEPEMVDGFLVGKTHHLVPALYNTLMMSVLGRTFVWRGWLLLRDVSGQRKRQKG